jgi:aspartate/methionine/tyrosine aminotransferase
LGTDDPEIARAAAYFVEITTSGVSIISQEVLATTLHSMRGVGSMEFYTERTLAARATLMANGVAFSEWIGPMCQEVYGVPRDGSGMFAWFRADRPESMARALRDAKVKVVTGDACGQPAPGWFRMSMGHDQEITDAALARIRYEYYRGWVGQ